MEHQEILDLLMKQAILNLLPENGTLLMISETQIMM